MSFTVKEEKKFFFPLKEMEPGATSDFQILVFIMKLQSQPYQNNFNYNKIENLPYLCGYTSHYN